MRQFNQGNVIMLKSVERIKYYLAASWVWMVVLGLGASAHAATLENTEVITEGAQIQVHLVFSEKMSMPQFFTIDEPARVVLDFPRSMPATTLGKQKIDVGPLGSLAVLGVAGKTRVVLSLTEMVPHEVQMKENRVIVILRTNGGVAAPAMDVTFPGDHPDVMHAREIEHVDFHRTSDGAGRVIVQLSDPSTPVDIRQEGSRVAVELFDVHLPEHLAQRLEVIDFATPVETIDTRRKGKNATISIANAGHFEQIAYQADGVLTVEVRPLTRSEEEERKRDQFTYTGERLSLNFQDIEVRSVLQLIADFTGLNMVASDTVSGNVTLRLQNVPWDQAMDIILKSKGLSKRTSGNVMMVAPAEELAAREKLELLANQQVEELAPLRSEYIQINYAKAGTLANLLKDSNNSILSPRGNVAVDERTNLLLVQDTSVKLDEIRSVIARLDIPVRQVMIEARIVNVTKEATREIGMRLGGQGKRELFQNGTRLGVSGSLENAAAQAEATQSSTVLDRLFVNLPTTGRPETGTLGLALAHLPGNALLDLELSALETENKAEIIASPRLLTANQKEARIESGEEIPFQEASSSGATSTSFKKAVLALQVTPQITPDNRIILDLIVNQDERVGDSATSVPIIDTKEVQTQVLVDNGETIVLGGIYKQNINTQSDRVPYLSDIPMLGRLFKGKSTTDERNELLIFITPRIVSETGSHFST